jgi:aspartate racemase
VKIIGLIGGMSWESTIPYYRQINETVKQRLGGLHSAKLILYSVDFHDVERMLRDSDWVGLGDSLANAAHTLESAGAHGLVLCTNTMHRVASVIESAVGIPLLHIADATADEIKRAGFATVGLIGTRVTMEADFYRDRLTTRHGLRVLVPNGRDRELLNQVIFEELCLGKLLDDSRAEFRRIMRELAANGAQAIILGCTEISMLVAQSDTSVPLFDTTNIHARKAADWALQA